MNFTFAHNNLNVYDLDASVLRIRGWGFISFPILTDIGWRSYLKIYNIKKGSFL